MLSRLTTVAVLLSLLVFALTSAGCAGTPGALPPTRAVTAQTLNRPGVHVPVPQRYQGDTMACGPSSLWAVMSYHLGAGKVNFDNLDKSLRPTGHLTGAIGTMPGALAKAPERYHLQATVHNNGTTRDLRQQLDAGLPPIILGVHDDGAGGGGLHYVVVNGYEGSVNDDTTWTITDSLVKDGKERHWTTAELMHFWSDLTLVGRRIPYQKAIIGVAPKAMADALPAENRTAWLRFLDSTVKTVFDLLRWLDNGRNGDAPPGWVPPPGI